MLAAFGPYKHIANLGHGLYPDTEVDKVKCYIETVKEVSASILQALHLLAENLARLIE